VCEYKTLFTLKTGTIKTKMGDGQEQSLHNCTKKRKPNAKKRQQPTGEMES